MSKNLKLERLKTLLTLCEPSLVAMGDSTRLQLIKFILDLDKDCTGISVGDLTQKADLSRPAISHHLKILKEAGIVTLRREGTKNYYHLDSNPASL